MKKLIIAVVIILAIAFIGAPYLTGKVAEPQVQKLIDQLNQSPLENGTNEILFYQRGILSTESRYRYTLPAQYKALLNGLESFEYQCDLEHGMLGIDYQCRISENEAYTAFINEYFGSKDPISMHGSVSVLGGLSTTLAVSDISDFKLDNGGSIDITETVINISSDKSLTDFDITGGSKHFSLVSGEESMSIDNVVVDGALSKIPGDLFVGTFSFSVGDILLEGSDSNLTLAGLKSSSEAKLNGENIDSTTTLSIGQLSASNSAFSTITEVNFIARVNGINAAAMSDYQAFNNQLQAQALNADGTTNPIDPMQMVPIMERMLVKGFNIGADLSGKLDDRQNSVAFDLELEDAFTMNDAIALAYAPQESLNKLGLTLATKLDKDTVSKDANLRSSVQNSQLFEQTNDGYALDLKLGKVIELNGKPISAEQLQALVMSGAGQ